MLKFSGTGPEMVISHAITANPEAALCLESLALIHLIVVGFVMIDKTTQKHCNACNIFWGNNYPI
jgi:hypothetical protein